MARVHPMAHDFIVNGMNSGPHGFKHIWPRVNQHLNFLLLSSSLVLLFFKWGPNIKNQKEAKLDQPGTSKGLTAHLLEKRADGDEEPLEWWGRKEFRLPPGTVEPSQKRMFSSTCHQKDTVLRWKGCPNGTVFVSGQLCSLGKQTTEGGSRKHHSLQELKAQQLHWGLQASFRYAKT